MPNGHSTHHTCPAFRTLRRQSGTRLFTHGVIIVVILSCTNLIIGCGGPQIDASSEQSMQASIEHIRSTLGNEDRAAFDIALIYLNDMLFNNTDAVSQATISLYRPEALIRKILHAKTARKVIVMVEKHKQ